MKAHKIVKHGLEAFLLLLSEISRPGSVTVQSHYFMQGIWGIGLIKDLLISHMMFKVGLGDFCW